MRSFIHRDAIQEKEGSFFSRSAGGAPGGAGRDEPAEAEIPFLPPKPFPSRTRAAMNRTARIALLGGATFLVILLFGLDTSSDMFYDDPHATSVHPDAPPADGARSEQHASSSQGQRVMLVDQGLQMPRGSQIVPAGWQLSQDIATDPNTAMLVRYRTELRGPNGEASFGLGHVPYGPMAGVGFEQAWREAVMRGLQGEVQDLELGELRRSAHIEQQASFQRVAQETRQQGNEVQGLEAPLRGRVDGRAVEGLAFVLHIFSPQMPGLGTLGVSALTSPPERLEEALRLADRMAASFEPNPAFEQRVRQITQQAMAASQAQHQQHMAARDAQFSAHQQRMASQQAAFDAQNRSWQAQQRSNDEMHRRAVNSIHGTVDLYDAQSGQAYYGVESGADAYWTDPVGDGVVGTQGYDNPDVMRYNPATDFDNLYNQGAGW